VTLLKRDGEWKIMSKVYNTETKTEEGWPGL